jgi:hypothetical protein
MSGLLGECLRMASRILTGGALGAGRKWCGRLRASLVSTRHTAVDGPPIASAARIRLRARVWISYARPAASISLSPRGPVRGAEQSRTALQLPHGPAHEERPTAVQVPWQAATGPKTPEGKRRSGENLRRWWAAQRAKRH